ncbi:MAG TPA: hypothetical protein VFW02_09305 [Candidatus Limnocylindrales bacterium]|nr:hypothetical protein [Candidatus Limnocylindrales bacterium]
MSDVVVLALTLVVPVIVVLWLVMASRPRSWALDHPLGARRAAVLGAGLGATARRAAVGPRCLDCSGHLDRIVDRPGLHPLSRLAAAIQPRRA